MVYAQCYCQRQITFSGDTVVVLTSDNETSCKV